jgi:hypothetical protein
MGYLKGEFTSHAIIGMIFNLVSGEGYVLASIKTDLTDALYARFGFRTDAEIAAARQMKKFFKNTNKRCESRDFLESLKGMKHSVGNRSEYYCHLQLLNTRAYRNRRKRIAFFET